MARRKRFKPPKVTNPPTLVEVEWIDAQTDIMHDGPAAEAGGFFVSTRCGYYVRHSPKDENGPFVVLAMEHSPGDEKDGGVNVRDIFTLPISWVRRWSEVASQKQVYPSEQKEATSGHGIPPAAAPGSGT